MDVAKRKTSVTVDADLLAVGGGIVLTADPDDLGRLAAGAGRVGVMPV